MPFQVPRQRPQRGQRGRAGPVQVIQADQDRSRRGPLFEVRPYLGDPPRSRIRQIAAGVVGGQPGERLAQGRAQREERNRLAQRVRGSRGQRKALVRCLVDGVAEQQGLADARLPVHQHHAASTPLSAPQQVTDHLLLRLMPAHNLAAGRSLPRRHPPARSRGGVTDHRGHITTSASRLKISRAPPPCGPTGTCPQGRKPAPRCRATLSDAPWSSERRQYAPLLAPGSFPSPSAFPARRRQGWLTPLSTW